MYICLQPFKLLELFDRFSLGTAPPLEALKLSDGRIFGGTPDGEPIGGACELHIFVCTCVYMEVCICMHVCMYVHICSVCMQCVYMEVFRTATQLAMLAFCTYLYVWRGHRYVCVYALYARYVHMYVSTYAFRIYMHTRIHIYICMHTVHTYEHTYIRTHIHTHAMTKHTYAHTHTEDLAG